MCHVDRSTMIVDQRHAGGIGTILRELARGRVHLSVKPRLLYSVVLPLFVCRVPVRTVLPHPFSVGSLHVHLSLCACIHLSLSLALYTGQSLSLLRVVSRSGAEMEEVSILFERTFSPNSAIFRSNFMNLP